MIQTFTVPIIVNIFPRKEALVLSFPINISVLPEETPSYSISYTGVNKISTFPVELNVSDPLISSAIEFLTSTFESYVDEDRELKTLLNYGEDLQTVALAYRYGPLDENNIPSVQLKLLTPVPDTVAENVSVFLSRELAKSIIDKFRIRFAPQIDATPYLRPKNLSALTNLDTGKSVNNVTLNTLSLQSGSIGISDTYKNVSFEDRIFRQWYSYDFNSSELNLDFTDYNNFVFYGSAAMRLSAFREKLRQLELIDANRIQFLSSSTYIGNPSSSGFLFVQQKSAEYSAQKEDVIRAFDRYEQYLYFTPSGSQLPYSASAYYVDGGIEYNEFSYWPKTVSGSVYSIYASESIAWYNQQLQIAQRFDEFNENNLVNTIPTYIREDENSSSYVTFVSMTGHFFDLLKPYIDQMLYVWSRNLNPNKELSKDLIHEIAESVGFVMPTIDSTYDITDSILGTTSETPRRELTAQIYKRLLHNLPFFAKAKGTKSALDSFLRTFGLPPQIVSIKESGTPVSGSYYVYDEFSTVLDFDASKISYVSLPVSASNRSPKMLQFSCVVAKQQHMTIATGDNRWALNVSPHPTNKELGRFEIVSGSSQTLIMSSSYQHIYNESPNSVVIDVQGSTAVFRVIQTEGEDIVFDSINIESTKFSPLWNNTQFIYLGGTGPLVVSRFEGYIDEVRLWNDNLSNQSILNAAFDPGSSAGDTYDAASNNLLIQLSFNNVNTALLTASSSLENESPYKNIAAAPSIEQIFAFNFTELDFSRYNRTVRQDMLLGGSSTPLTTKVKVAEPAKFIDSSDGLRLYKNKSIVVPETKKYTRGKNRVTIASSPTDIINQNIIRSIGLENINALLGFPSDLYTSYDLSLRMLKNHYQQYYNVTVDKNRFTRIMSEMGQIINQVVDYFVPAKANLLKGIIIEPNVLEQVKLRPVKSVKVYGKNTRRTLTAANSRTGSASDYSATFNLSDTVDAIESSTVQGSYKTYKGSLADLAKDPNVSLSGKISQPSSSVQVSPTMTDNGISKLQTDLTVITSLKSDPVNKLSGDIDGLITVVSSSISNLRATIERANINISSSYSTHQAKLDSANPQMIGSYDTKLSSVNVASEMDVSANYNTYNLKHIATSLLNIAKQLSGSTKPSSVDMELSNMNKIPYNDVNYGSPGAEPFNRVYARKLFPFEIQTSRNGGLTSLYKPALYDIPPSADFRDYGVYTYFNRSTGIYYFPETVKTPAYFKPLTQTWNFESQSFYSNTTWEYGNRYNIYDVVYQSIDQSYSSTLGADLVRASSAGNGLYYVFKTRPSYKASSDGSFYYSGSVPSYIPPSLDRENWEPLRFTPVTRLRPRRVVFDVFTNSNLSQTNFKTTTISIDKNVDAPARYIDAIEVSSIPANTYVTGEVLAQNIAVLFAIQSNFGGLRVRLYRTPQARTSDINRSISTKPTGSHGVLLDMQIPSSNVAVFTNPIPTLVADGIPPNGKLYYTIDNLESVSKLSVTMLLYYFALQIEPKIPRGYLRKHYRFFRDNSTALKRRNYIGCKNTQSTTIDGLPAIQIFLSEGTDVIVSPTQTNEEIITGGGGQLNVT